MKISLIVIAIATIFFTQNSLAQNVGIGIISPLSKLHIFNGASGATPFFSTALAVESNANTYLNLLSTALNETAILFGTPSNSANGVIMYNNPVTPNGFQFRNNGNQTRMIIDNAGNVGIGTTTPGNLLEIKNSGVTTPGLRINNTTATWQLGVGINAANDALFGIYNSSAGNAFVINTSGNVGIGNTNPGYLLDVNNRMRIRSGGDNSVSAGLWLNNNTNTEASFIGMEDDTHVGFFGTGTGWKFGMNTQTGALKINGSEGQAGQVLQSNGAGLAPIWVNSATVHSIGEGYGGGIVFYVYENGQHGLIASTTDQYNSIQWALSNSYTNAVRNGIGANTYNTEHIINNQGGGLYAAWECAQYNGGGYGDWYLPCKYELNLLYQQKNLVGGFAGANYWSSSELSFVTSWSQSFVTGVQTYDNKTNTYHIRAIRAF